MQTQERNFYYLNGLSAKRISRQTLMLDMQRGVKRIAENSYTTNYGTTQASLQFALALLETFGDDFLVSSKAALTFSKKNWFKLHLYTVRGYEIVFEGLAGGYFGEGTRGCYDILKVAGFSQKQCAYPFKKETFTCSKRTH